MKYAYFAIAGACAILAIAACQPAESQTSEPDQMQLTAETPKCLVYKKIVSGHWVIVVESKGAPGTCDVATS